MGSSERRPRRSAFGALPFFHPREVVEYPELPEDQKRRILLDWLEDEFALLVADDEGMVGDEPPRPDLVLEALLALSVGHEAWQRSMRSTRPSSSPHTGLAGAPSFPSG